MMVIFPMILSWWTHGGWVTLLVATFMVTAEHRTVEGLRRLLVQQTQIFLREARCGRRYTKILSPMLEKINKNYQLLVSRDVPEGDYGADLEAEIELEHELEATAILPEGETV